ncbi:MAG: paraquat-inducible protein A [Halioglobus sp.]
MSIPRKLMTLLFLAIAIALLYPGVTQPVLTLSGMVEKSKIAELGIGLMTEQDTDSQTGQMLTAISRFLGFDQIEGQLQVYSSTRSLWGTAEALASSGHLGVALLIVFFSMVIPTIKLFLQATSLFIAKEDLRAPLLCLNAALSKWSMADVFVMALLVAFLAGGVAEQSDDIVTMHASLGAGFYYFLAYCLFSVAAGALMVTRRLNE